MEVSFGQPIDYVVVALYFVVILGFGALVGKNTRSTRDFFFSGHRFSWWLISFSCVATVVGSYSFIKYTAAGFSYGLSSSMTYLNDWFLLPLFMFGWLPIIYFSRVTSIPEYFERRFDRRTRVMAVVFTMIYLVGYIGINLYTLGVALHAIVPGISAFQWAGIISVVVAAYVAFGGQTAVIMTDLLQAVLLLSAGLFLFFLGLDYLEDHNPEGLSGIVAFWKGLPPEHRMPFSGLTTPAKFPMVGILWQDLFGASMFFYFGNQGLIMRFLACKSVADGRRALIVLMLVLMPIAILAVGNAGWLGRSLASFDLIPKDSDPNNIFIIVTELVTQPGVFGLILAALTAALMSTVDTLINAVSAIAINDVYRPFIAPGKSDRHYLWVARVSSVGFAFAGLLLVPVFMSFKSIYLAHGAFTASISPPIISVVLLGTLWKRFSAKAAFLTLLGGGILVGASVAFPQMIAPLADLHGMEPGRGYEYMRALFGMVVCMLLGTTGGLIWPNRNPESLVGLWVGSLKQAKRLFKKGEPNDREFGEKLKLRLVPGEASGLEPSEIPQVTLAGPDAARMKSREGDLIYLCDKRWWLGGMRSLHARLHIADVRCGSVIVPVDHIQYSGLRVSEQIVVEKIL